MDRLLGAAFTASSAAMAVVGADGRVVEANPAFCLAVGRRRDELIGADALSAASASHAEASVERFGDHAVLTLLPPSGLVESERRYRAIFQNTFEFIGLLSPDGILLEANRTALAFIGHPDMAQLAGRHFADTPWWQHSPEDQATLRAAIAAAAKGEFVRFESTHLDPDGNAVVVDFSLRPMTDEDGTVIYLLPEGRDITQRKEAEEAAFAARMEAEAANRAKSQFLATISHELRTPLNAVIGFSETIQAEVFGPLGNSRYAEYVDLIHSAGQLLRDLIEDILDVARVESGESPLSESEFDLVPLLSSTLRLIEAKAAARRVALQVDLAQGLPRLWGDSLRIRQIVLNLLTNAIKFTPEGGSVRLSAALCPEGLELVVADTGIGISATDLPHVWRPFFQVEGSMARRYGGAGLGLPIVRHFVEAHGGRIEIDSTLGEGTVARVILPRSRLRDVANTPGAIESSDRLSR